MNIVTTRNPIINGDMKSWVNDTSIPPDWVKEYMLGSIETNYSFVIRTPLGNARVHYNYVVIEYRGEVYTSEAAEVENLIGQLRVHQEISTSIAVGPGKRLDRSGVGLSPKQKHTQKRAITHAKPRGTPPSIEWVEVACLSVDTSYQRSIDNEASRRLIGSIVVNFDWRLCAPLVVSRRLSGELVVIDGQHRTMAAQRRKDILYLPCCIFNYEGPEEEARMFILANRSRKPMNRLDDFHAALAARDEDALEIHTLVTDAGLKVARNTSSTAWQPGEIAFTSTIASSLRRHGPAIVSAALINLIEAFPAERLTHGGSIFLGLVKIFSRPPENFDPDLMFEVLKQRTAEQWGQIVTGLKGGDTRATIVQEALLEAYRNMALLTQCEMQHL